MVSAGPRPDPRRHSLIGGVRLSLLPDRFASISRLGLDGVPERITSTVEDRAPLNGQQSGLWTPAPDQVLKLTWGTASQDTDQFNLPEAERIATLEANYTLTRPRWMLTAGLFQNRLSQLVRTIQRVDPQTGTYLTEDDNSGRWRARGLELIAEAQPLPALHLGASLTWQRTQDLDTDIDPGYSPACWPSSRPTGARGP